MEQPILDLVKYANDLHAKQLVPNLLQIAGQDFYTLPAGVQLVDIEKHLPNPRRYHVEEKFIDVDGFCNYTDRYKSADMVLFGHVDGGAIEATFNYGQAEKPGWGDHRAVLQLKQTPDYKEWLDNDGREMSQVTFAEFIENLSHTVKEPDSAKIVDIAEHLQIQSNRTFAGKIDRTTGAQSVSFVDDVTTGGGGKESVTLPNLIEIVLQPYYASRATTFLVRLRIRINNGRPVFYYEIDRPWKFENDSFNAIVREVEENVGQAVLLQP